MKIIPAIDLIDGKCVRLTQGKFDQKKIYHDKPLEVAKKCEDAGCTHLHLVDLDAAKNGQLTHLDVLGDIARHTSLFIDFGGGISDRQAIVQALNAGAKQVNIGTAAVTMKNEFFEWIDEFGGDRIILSADVESEKISIRGWQEKTEIELKDILLEYSALGVKYVTCTDVSRDGLLAGPALSLYRKVLSWCPQIKLIASGGVRGGRDLVDLKNLGCTGAIVGKAIYEGRITFAELQKFSEQ